MKQFLAALHQGLRSNCLISISSPLQAAAHGLPTIATKNGGPVDIMQTLHSGLLVDPTNSKEIANACLKILTQPDIWDKMSQNGDRPELS